jgi:hypothetical protein
MPIPNFLIVGAAKSGTTSLSNYLKQHPDIYISSIKEPKFMVAHSIDFPTKPNKKVVVVKDWKEYENLFAAVTTETAIGEASAVYLYQYETAISNIKKYLGDPKIILILRNPVERTFSAYTHFLREGLEKLSFEEAINNEEKRIADRWGFLWHYKSASQYFQQVKAYLESFNNVKIVLNEELKNDRSGVIKNLYDFLEVDPTFEPDLTMTLNPSGVPKSGALYRLLARPNVVKKLGKKAMGLFMTDEKMRKRSLGWQSKLVTKPQMSEADRSYLKEYFREDILKLQDLLGRDLSNWID